MYSEKIESLIDMIVEMGELDETNVEVIRTAAANEDENPDEVVLVLKNRLFKSKQQAQQVQQTQQQEPQTIPSSPKVVTSNEKKGNVVKCPSCGAQVIGGSAVCPECGYAFSNVEANHSIEILNKKIETLYSELKSKGGFLGDILGHTSRIEEEIHQTIASFPVPNSREDLVEFITAILPRSNPNKYSGDYGYAYWELLSNCINKARFSFSNDKSFEFLFQKYEELNNTKRSGLTGHFKSLFD